MLTFGSVVLALVNLAVMWLIARRKSAGWLIGIAGQVPWTFYDVVTRQYGFIAITVAVIPVYVKGYRNFRAGPRE